MTLYVISNNILYFDLMFSEFINLFQSGVPRTGYRGVVSFMYKGRRVYLAPPADWKGYDPTWS